MTLLAQTHNFANAQAINGSSISLTTFGNLYAESHALDSANATISGATITTTAGDVDVDSRIVSTSTSTRTPRAPPPVFPSPTRTPRHMSALPMLNSPAASASRTRRSSSLRQCGTLRLQHRLRRVHHHQGRPFLHRPHQCLTLPTESYYDTYAGITDESDVTAANISVKAEDYTRAKSDAWDQSIAVTVSVATTQGVNTIHSDTNATIERAPSSPRTM